MDELLLEIQNSMPRGRPLKRPDLPAHLQRNFLTSVEKPIADLYTLYRTYIGKKARGTHFTKAACQLLQLKPIPARRVLRALGYEQRQTRIANIVTKVWRHPEDKDAKPARN